ncbi:N-acetylglutamate synthase, GNAT family [Peptoniphilus asaccharolyticus DSM 20463]|uniref:N-acetylglutamate synthase, GNAT family n=1 Tax=Peptoniphilus asaccharolyticus DSM 20463 TaxID=573058 RepID=A0A1W1UQ80_PEPAS|nr:GNAT family N-acetyltransferase [Peptoniphilus asaccharolyticus]MBL7575012.1 GNAT family N-acetyltransferase [Peptoniphilus asaccharolyticus]SMB83149.1 N-acetylglutamate synthase, GNAT family [Peptoniphilus asaccharolyticus DSM 20463]
MIRRFKVEDAKEGSALIKRTLYEVNSKDYEDRFLEDSSIQLSENDLIERAKKNNYYVCEENEKIVGIGGIGSYCGKEDESYIMSVFVLPEYIGKGIGRNIVETLEKDEYALRSNRIEVASSITAVGFYKEMGYRFKNNDSRLNEVEQNYRMEKFLK